MTLLILASTAVDLATTSDIRLVILSVMVSLIGAYTAFDIAEQIPVDRSKPRQFWIIGSGIALGLSIWVMHFTGILGHQLPISVGYDFGLVLLAIVISVSGAVLGMWLVNQPDRIWWAIGGICIGSTVITMHYVAMASLQMAATQTYDPSLVVLSGAVAIGATFAGLGLLRHHQLSATPTPFWQVVIGALCLCAAISGMHYIAIHATHIRAAPMLRPQILPIGGEVLAVAIGVAASLILIVALLASFFGRRLSAERARVEALQISEARLEQLVQQRTQELEAEKLASEAASSAKSTFLANTSHELRTPLTAIIGFSSVLLEQIFGTLNPQQLEYMQRISGAGYQLLALINDLLDLAKVESGREELLLESVCVEEVCQSCLETLRKQAEERELQFSVSIDPQVTTCTADQRRLTQILLNLLSNAVKFTDAGAVTLEVKKAERYIQFIVCDTGIGIDPADQNKLFQPFQQIEQGLDRRYQGTGLGLALSQKLAQLQHGEITVKSARGEGSCFTLSLPV